MNIKENLLRMKDTTELMLDLAYSAVFLKDRQIAARVREMNKEITLLEDSTMMMLFRIKEPEEERLFIIDLTDSIKDVANAAMHIAELAESKVAHPIVKDILSESSRMVIAAKISHKSIYANKTIGESKIRTTTRAFIIGIKRDGNWLFDIDKNTKLLPNDEVIAVGRYEADKLFKKNASG